MDLHVSRPQTTARPAALREIADLPGPRGLPLVGNLLQVNPAHIHQHVEAWGREHGPFFRFRLGSRRFLGVTDHAAIAAALRDRPEGFRRTVRMEETWHDMGLDVGVFGANGDAWRRQRRMVMAAFDPAHVRAYFPALARVVGRLEQRWLKAAHEGAVIDLRADLMRYTVDAITGLAFGVEVDTLRSDGDVIQRHLDQIFPAFFKRLLALVPTWHYVRLPADRRLERSVAAVKAAVDGFIAQARERMRADPALRESPRNLLEAMIAAADHGDSGLGDRDVAGNVVTMLLAGEDTTANTLAWAFHLLHRHPEALRRAQAEVRRIAPDVAAFTPERIGALDYLEACLHETMRLKPVAPYQALQALRETTVGDIRVPAGTLVWAVMRHDSVDERHFPNALAFDPMRWLGAEGEPHAASTAKRLSMPFGGGPRICPGRYLAMLEMKVAAAMLLGRFEIESLEAPGGGEAEEHLSLTMAPVGLQMRLRPCEGI